MPTFPAALLTPWSLPFAAEAALHWKIEDSGVLKIFQLLHHLSFPVYFPLVQLRLSPLLTYGAAGARMRGPFPIPITSHSCQAAGAHPTRTPLHGGLKTQPTTNCREVGLYSQCKWEIRHTAPRVTHLRPGEVNGWGNRFPSTSCSRRYSNSSRRQV